MFGNKKAAGKAGTNNKAASKAESGKQRKVNKADPRIPKGMAKEIPFLSAAKEGDLLELAPGKFAAAFRIGDLDEAFDFNRFRHDRLQFQLSLFMLDGEPQRYITFNVGATTLDEARKIISSIRDEFPVDLEPLTLTEHLELIHRVYNFGSDKNMLDKIGGSDVDAKVVKKAKLSLKDLVGTHVFDAKKDFVETDNGFARVLFVNTFSDSVSGDFYKLNAPGMVTAVHFMPVDPGKILGQIEAEIAEYKKAAEKPKKTPYGTTKKSAKKKGDKSAREVYPNAESVSIKESYTSVFKEAVDEGQLVYRMTFLYGLFAKDLEDLDRMTADILNRMSDAGCKMTVMDYNQKKALAALLPLANPGTLNVSRTFSAGTAGMLFTASVFDTKLSPAKINASGAEMAYYTIKTKVEKKKQGSLIGPMKHTVQESIPYLAAHLQDGIIETSPGVFSRMYRFQDINYSTATEEDQTNFLIRYSQLLNRLDSTIKCQIVLNNRNVDMTEFKDDNLLKMKGDELDVYRKEYNSMILSKMEEGRNNLRKERYMVLSVEEDNLEAARHTFNRLDPEFVNAFKDIGGCKAEALSTLERMEILYDIYNVGHEGNFLSEVKNETGGTVKATDLETLYSMGVTSKDLIAPSGFDFKRNWFRMGDKYCRILYLMDLPNTLSDKFLSDLAATSCNMVISMNLETVRQDKAVRLVKHQMLNINSNMQTAQQTASKNGYSMDLVPMDLKQAQEEANDLLQSLTGKNQKMLLMTFTILVIANDMEELNNNTEILVTTGRKYLCNLKKLQYQQEAGLNATLPFCCSDLTTKRTLTTDSTIIFTPFDTQELIQPHGMYYGQNATSHNLILFNRESSQNGNGWILGVPGCVDKDTEYFNGKCWKPISEYTEDERVLQFDTETGIATLVRPKAYIKAPCNEMYHFIGMNGIDQVLSPEHRVAYYDNSGNIIDSVKVILAGYLAELLKAGKFEGNIRTDFLYDGPGCVYKDRDIETMAEAFNKRQGEDLCNVQPIFDEEWYRASRRQLWILSNLILSPEDVTADEAMTLTVANKSEADVVQFVLSSCGYRAVVRQDDGYAVDVYTDRLIPINKGTIVKTVRPADGYKYCFTVPKDTLVLRRNGNIFITKNSGKSFAAKQEMANVFLNTDDDILIIDPEREYSPLVKAFGGSIVRIAPGSKYHLNPLDMDKDYADDDDPIVLKSDFMLSLCESVIGGRYGLTPTQIAIIDRCVNLIYKDFVEVHDYDRAYTPTLLDFENVLEAQPEREARELALAFEIYTKGSLDVFAHESNVDIDNRFVVYDIKDIGSNIKTMAYLIVLDAIWNRVVKNRKLGKKTWIYIDEVYILFEKDESTNFIRQIFSRCRKWGGKITAITQNVEPILQNTIATTMLSNSAFIQLLNQAPVDRDILASLLHISPTQVGFISNAPAGQGVFYIQGQGIIPFRNAFNKNVAPELYKVMTSKPDELMEEFR